MLLTSLPQRSALACALLLSLAATTFAADRVPTERRLPANVLLYASCPSVEEMHSRFQDTSYGALLQDGGFDAIKDELMAKFEESSKDIEAELGMPLSDLPALMSGEATFAVIRPLGQTPGIIATIEVGDHRDILDKLLARLDKELLAKEATKEVEDYDGTEVIVYTIPNEKGRPFNLSYLVKDGVLAVGSSTAVLETLIDRWDGTNADCFAESALYKDVMSRALPDAGAAPVFKWFFTPVELIMAGLSMNSDTQMFAAIGSAYLPTLGLNKLKAMGGTVEIATEKYDFVTRSITVADPPASGLIKVFTFPDTLTGPPVWVPDTASQYTAAHWDLDTAYKAIGSIYDTFQGAPGAWDQLMDGLSQQPGNPGLHLKKDIIDTVTGVFQAYFIFPDDINPEEAKVPFDGVVSIGVTDEAKALKLLTTIVGASNGSVTEQDFQGHKVFVITNGDDEEHGAFAIFDKQIFLGDSIERVQNVILGRTGNPLTGSDFYKSVATHLPEKMSMTSFSDPTKVTPAMYEKLRAGEFDSALEGALDFSKLPPYEVIRKYLQPSASYMIPTDRGSMTVNFTLRRKQ